MPRLLGPIISILGLGLGVLACTPAAPPVKYRLSSAEKVDKTGQDQIESRDVERTLELAQEVKDLLDTSCGGCHSPQNPQGGFDHAADLEKLVAEGNYVVPGDPEASILYRRMAPTGDMPPSNPLDKELSDKVARWILELEQGSLLDQQALAILERDCASCHNPDQPYGDFGYVLNVEQMIESGTYLVPGDPEASLIFARLAPKGDMPPAAALADEDQEILRQWIESLKPEDREPISDREVLQLIRQDVENKVAANDRATTRYLSLVNAYNRNFSEQRLENLRLGFFKLINSLSRSPILRQPVAVDELKLIYRINLSDFTMDVLAFDQIMEELYPFSTRYIEIANDAIATQNANTDQFLVQSLQSSNYLLRVDWFNASAALPGIYERLLALGSNQQQLEQDVGVDRAANLANNQVLRAGFRKSNVSSQNRMIEHHSSATTGLSYWLSYDFAANSGQQNLFAFPLGPVGIGFDQKAFLHDGGEMIFQLPNGLFAYYLADAQGTAIDRGPQAIVRNDNGPRQLQGNILNGLSCMSCHGQGLLNNDDQVRDFVNLSQDFSVEEKSKVLALYPEQAVLRAQMDEDNRRYFQALQSLGVDPTKPDPIEASFGYYQQDLRRRDVLSELSITDELLAQVLQQEPFRSAWVELEKQDGLISREEFNQFAGLLVTRFVNEKQVVAPLLGDHLPRPSCMAGANLFLDSCTQPVGEVQPEIAEPAL